MPPGPPSFSFRAGLLRLAVGAWLGACLLFTAAVAPAAFAVAPSRELAGNFVGAVLPAVNGAGIALGLLVPLLGRDLGRPAWALGLSLAALCATSELWVSPAIAALRPLLHAGVADPATRTRFGQLHGLSVALLGGSVLCALALAGLSLRRERPRIP